MKSIWKIDKNFTTYSKYFHTITSIIHSNPFQVQTNRTLQIMNTSLLVLFKN